MIFQNAPDVDFSIALALALTALYVVSYVSARRHLKKHATIWSIPFWANFIYLVYLTGFQQKLVLRDLGLDSRLLDLSATVMTIGAALHHFSILLEKRGKTSRWIRLVHKQVSHSLVMVPFALNSVSVAVASFRGGGGFLEASLTVTYTLSSVYASMYLYRAGFKEIKVPY